MGHTRCWFPLAFLFLVSHSPGVTFVNCNRILLTESQEVIFDISKFSTNFNNVPLNQCTNLFVRKISHSPEVLPLGIDEIDFSKNPKILLNVNFSNKSTNWTLETTETIQYFHHVEACTIAFYWIQSRDFEGTHSTFLSKLPGGIFQSYHIIFLLDNLELNNFLTPPVHPIIRQMHNTLFITRKKNLTLELSTSNLRCNGSIPVGHYHNGKLTLLVQNALFFKKWENYNGDTLTMAVTPDYTQEEMEEFMRTKLIKKYTIVGTYEVFKGFNATPHLLPITPGIYGYKTKEGRWVGLIGAVLEGRADLTMSMQIIPTRMEVVMFPSLYFFDNVVFVTGLTKEVQRSGSLAFMVEPLKPGVWFGILLSFIAIYVVMSLHHLILQQYGHPCRKLVAMGSLILLPMLDQVGSPSSLRANTRDRLIRFLYSVWLLSLIVFGCAYKSRVIVALLSPTLIIPPTTFEELVASDYEIGAVAYNETFVGESLVDMNTTVAREVRRRVKGYEYTKPECYLNTQTKDHACIGVRALMEMIATNYLTDSNGKLLYKISKGNILPIFGGMTASKAFPHVLEPMSRITDRLVSGGFTRRWLELELRRNKIRGRILGKKFHSSGQEEKEKQGILHLITIILFGHGLGIISFLCEKILACVQRSRK